MFAFNLIAIVSLKFYSVNVEKTGSNFFHETHLDILRIKCFYTFLNTEYIRHIFVFL